MPNDIPYNKKAAKQVEKGALSGGPSLDDAIARWKGLVGMGALPPEATTGSRVRQIQAAPQQDANAGYFKEQPEPIVDLPPGVSMSDDDMESRIKRFNAGQGSDPLEVLEGIERRQKQRPIDEDARRRALESIRGR